MKLLLLSNSRIVAPLAQFLSDRAELIQHDEVIDCHYLRNLRPDLIVSYSYRYIITPDVLNCHPGHFINLHTSLLPYNRGADPNPWSFIENTPKGVTIHIIDAGIDTGPIIAQRRVNFDEKTETLAHSYQTLQSSVQELFFEQWPRVRDSRFNLVRQTHPGTFHNASEFRAIKQLLLGREGWEVPIPLFKERFRQLEACRFPL